MKRASIGFNDEYVLQGAREEADRQGKRLSEYVEELISRDLKAKLQYKIVAHYSNGDTKEEADFYTESDLQESVMAYGMILFRGEPLPYYKPETVYLTGFEVWKHGKMTVKQGEGKQNENYNTF